MPHRHRSHPVITSLRPSASRVMAAAGAPVDAGRTAPPGHAPPAAVVLR